MTERRSQTHGWKCHRGHLSLTHTDEQPRECQYVRCASRLLTRFPLTPPKHDRRQP